jgi:hypothetical protein
MIWRKKSERSPPQRLQPQPVLSPEQSVAEALRAYQDHFYETVRGSSSDEATKAREIVERAKRIVGESGLGPALAPTLLEHVKHWPSWSKRSDFAEYVRFPCRYIRGSQGERGAPTIVSFAYKDVLYTVRFVDKGMSSWSTEDLNAYGTVHLFRNEQEVFGLDIHNDMSEGDAATWRWSDVLAFQAGPWMKDLIEMAGYIEGNRWGRIERQRDIDLMARAAKIQLPN